jgi:hypothetical protein
MSPLNNNMCYNDENDTDCRIAASVSPKSSKRSISFSSEVFVINVLHIMDYSAEEKQAAWYVREDITSFKNQGKVSATLMANGVSENAELCFRGLEARTRDGALRKRRNKILARAAVFMVQDFPEIEGVFDEEAIADAYYECTLHCHVAANMMGLRDERDARAMDVVLLVEELAFKAPPVLGYSYNRVVLLNVAGGPESMRKVSSAAA